MAIDYFMKIDGIAGESDDAKHKGAIELLSWSWGETNDPQPAGAGAGKVQMEDLHFTAGASKASPPLLLACATGKHFKTAILTARKAGGQPLDYLTLTLSEVVVSSYRTGGSEGEALPMDAVSLSYSRLQMEYREQKPDGTLGPAVKAGWDVKANKKL